MRYESRKNGQIFEQVSEVDPKYKTVLIRNTDTGKEQWISVSTLKRWYKKLTEESVVIEEPTPVEVSATVTEEPSAVIDKLAVEPVVANVPKKTTKSKRDDGEALAYIEAVAAEYGFTSTTRPNDPNVHNYRLNSGSNVAFIVTSLPRALRIHCTTTSLPEVVHSRMKHTKYRFNCEQVIDFPSDKGFIREVIGNIKIG